MKKISVIIITALLIVSCNDNRVEVARQYAQDNINRSGKFDVQIIEFTKINGESYVSKKTGRDMYALEFNALVKSNQSGYIIVAEDSQVRNFNIFDYDISKNLKYSSVKYITQGDEFTIHSRIIMNKTEVEWKPIAMRWDIY